MSKRDECQFMIGGEPCGHDLTGHRPYAYKRDGIPSVTGVIGTLDGGKSSSFAWVAATIGARYAVHSEGDLGLLSTDGCDHEEKRYCERCKFLRSRFDAEWTAKANLGTHVHHMALSWANGESVEQSSVSAPYLDALARFYDECRPEWEQLERTVEYSGTDHEYRGQFDAIGTFTFPSERKRGLIDVKTGQLHFTEMTIQLASYRFAEYMTTWEDKKVVEREPVPEVETAAILWLRPDGEYRLIELPSDIAAFDQFLKLRELWTWQRQMEAMQKAWIKDDETKVPVAA